MIILAFLEIYGFKMAILLEVLYKLTPKNLKFGQYFDLEMAEGRRKASVIFPVRAGAVGLYTEALVGSQQ